MAAGESLAPLGVALPPPRDMKEVRKLDQALQEKKNLKKTEVSEYTNLPTNKTLV